MTDADAVLVERGGPVTIVSINRQHAKCAADGRSSPRAKRCPVRHALRPASAVTARTARIARKASFEFAPRISGEGPTRESDLAENSPPPNPNLYQASDSAIV